MGGCLSTNTPSKHTKPSDYAPQSTNISKSPPPSHEEETVKEVLSETPSTRAHESPFIKNAPLLSPDHEKPYSAADDVSEICSSIGESESVSDDRLRHGSPAKRKNATSPGKSRTVGRSPGPGNVKRRDGGETSGRRLMSPAARTDSGRSRRMGKSPGSGEKTPRVEGEREDASGESLENPVVSMECFIFL